MAQYIDKDALVAEIERRQDYYKRNPLLVNAKYCIDEDNAILKFLDTLEVKEVDLEKSISDWLNEGLPNEEELLDYIKETAKHFYELGLKVQKRE